jgi:leader peptidase (prepilin peptidase)/N-methyltransferase
MLRPRLTGLRCGVAEVIGILAVIAIAFATLGGMFPLAAGIAMALLVPPAVVDVHEQRLPDAWIATALVGFAAALVVDAAFGGSVGLHSVAAGALVMCAPIAVLHLVSPASMGFGDVKLSIVLGGALGTVDWRLAMVALCSAGLLGATYGLAARRRTVPFGPFLVSGTLAALFASGPILTAFVDAGASS